MKQSKKTIVLGNEYDEQLRGRLMEVIKEMGGAPISRDCAVVGSQEINHLSIEIHGEVVDIEAETYIGLSVSGPDRLIDEIVYLMKL